MRKVFILFVLMFCPMAIANGWEVNKTISVGFLSESNILHEISDKWYKKDSALEETLKLSFSEEARPGKRWTIGIDLRNHDNRGFSSYDRFFSGLKISYREKSGLGMRAPWWRFQAGIGTERFPNSTVHNQTLTDLNVEYGRRLNPRTVVSGNIGYDQAYGANTETLDIKGVSANLQGQYSLDNRWALSLGVHGRKGDVAVHYWDGGYYHYYPEMSMPEWEKWKGKEKVMARVGGAESLKWTVGLIFNSGKQSYWNLGWETVGITKEAWTYHDKIFKVQFNHNF